MKHEPQPQPFDFDRAEFISDTGQPEPVEKNPAAQLMSINADIARLEAALGRGSSDHEDANTRQSLADLRLTRSELEAKLRDEDNQEELAA